MTRRDPNKDEMIGALVFAWFEAIGLPIPHEHQQLMTPDQARSLVNFDHYPIRYVDGGTTHPSNLSVKTIGAHREKTRKIDVPQIRKADRIKKKQGRKPMMPGPVPGGMIEVEFVMDDTNPGVLRAPDPVRDPELYERRPRPKSRLQGRGFDKSRTRTFGGKVVPRKQRRRT